MIQLSLIVTCKNQGDNVERILRHLESVVDKERFEIVIVDDKSEDDSWETIKTAMIAAKREGLNVRANTTDCRYAGGARNVGAMCSRGRYIWFIDGDDLPLALGVDAIIKDVCVRGDAECLLLKHIELRPNDTVMFEPEAKPTYADVCEFRVAPWCKVIKRSRFVPFREGVLLEDGDWWYAQCDGFNHLNEFRSITDTCCYQYDRAVTGQTMESLDKIIHNRFKTEKPLTLAEMISGKDGFSVGMPKIFADRLLQIGTMIRLFQTVEHKTVREQLKKVLFGLETSFGAHYHGLLEFVLP